MGKAIIISGADFSAAGIGQVTSTEYRELLSIALEEGATVGNKVTIDVTYNPHNATYKELIWSIESGSEYATISNGVLNVLDGADNSPVTVKAVSAYDSSIYDSITVNVTHVDLPYDEEVLYLETDGTAYIDTLVNTSSNTRFEIKMGLPSEPDNGGLFPFGARKVSNSNCMEFVRSKDFDQWQWRFGNVKNQLAFGAKPVDGYYEVSNTGSGNVLSLNVSNYENEVECTANTFDTELNFFLFRLNNQGTPRETEAGIKIYACKMYVGSTLVRDFIPVVLDGVGYLYDKISMDLFGNAADSGAFTYGNAVTEDEINEHEGLLFDGQSAIDTGIPVSGSHKIEIKMTAISRFENTTSQEYRLVLGGRTSNAANRRDIQYFKIGGSYANLYPQRWGFGTGSASENISATKQNGTAVTLLSTPSSVAVDNTAESVSIPSFDIAPNYFVGCQSQADGTVSQTSIIYDVIQYVKIWDSNDTLIAHFVPATYQGEAGLWDKIGDNFHGNALSGTLKAI